MFLFYFTTSEPNELQSNGIPDILTVLLCLQMRYGSTIRASILYSAVRASMSKASAAAVLVDEVFDDYRKFRPDDAMVIVFRPLERDERRRRRG